MQPYKYLGIEIGGTKLQLLVADEKGNQEQIIRYQINPEAGAESILNQIRAGWQSLNNNDSIAAIGVGFGGPVDWETGTICVSHQVSGWSHFNLAHWMKQLTGKPAIVENDANTAALAEALLGSGKGHQRVFYMTIGSGIGGGMIVDKSVYHGKKPGEVEIGHIRLNKEGATVESKCSGWAVNKKVRHFISQQPSSILAQLATDQAVPEAMLLQPAFDKGDKAAKKIIEEVADDLSFALSHVVHLFHPDVLVIGGGLSFLGHSLIQPIAQSLPKYLMHAFLPAPPVMVASLRESVVPMGAVELAKRIFLTDQTQISNT